jgi:uncharacterized protein YceH (UPF0502 family)
MPPILSLNEQRVLGCLLEKEILTPEGYPMTLNSLRLACNQKTSREPVMELSDEDVSLALYNLKGKDLTVTRTDARATKYGQKLESAGALNGGQRAVLTLLLLRGPQTAGELRGRSERLHTFASPAETEQALESLAAYQGGPWVQRLPKAPGEKEARWQQLLGGGITEQDVKEAIAADETGSLTARIEDLETEVAALRHAVKGLEERLNSQRTHVDTQA